MTRLGVMVRQRPVAGRRLVPDHEVSLGPPPPHLDVRVVEHRVQPVQHMAVGCPADRRSGVVQRREEQAAAAGDWVRRDEWVLDARVFSSESLGHLRAVVALYRREQGGFGGVEQRRPLALLVASGGRASNIARSTPRSCRHRTPGSSRPIGSRRRVADAVGSGRCATESRRWTRCRVLDGRDGHRARSRRHLHR